MCTRDHCWVQKSGQSLRTTHALVASLGPVHPRPRGAPGTMTLAWQSLAQRKDPADLLWKEGLPRIVQRDFIWTEVRPLGRKALPFTALLISPGMLRSNSSYHYGNWLRFDKYSPLCKPGTQAGLMVPW